MPALRQSPLAAAHADLGAKMVPFGGWEMPLAYPSGTIAEHRACREAAVAFDVSHLGTVRVETESAFDLLQGHLCNDLGKIGPGRAQYTLLLDPGDGSAVDDLIVWWVATNHFDLMPNASNTDRVRGALGGRDVTAERAVVAVQGPAARERLAAVSPEAAAVAHFGVTHFDWQGETAVAAGTGYTGEDGVECAVPASVAGAFWSAVLDQGVVPAGLGARDTLRLEAGLPLHGNELGPEITPLQAGLSWAVGWSKGDFQGRAALEEEREAGLGRRLRGLVLAGRQPPRHGYPVTADDRPVGHVTSGNFSPVLGRGIALALLAPEVEPGAEVQVDLRGRPATARVVTPPFAGPRAALPPDLVASS
ncbi:MAG TPA: glycine cleavage system aminomethyltransferase GcvT [Acidimicrobiales bacterium]|nr:glycine cleavage system aminomethyltransferase GcvT [Acidimicrobiales bacterium]